MGFLDNDGLTRLWGKITGKFTLKQDSIKNIVRNGTTFTATRADNTTFTFDQQDETGGQQLIVKPITIPATGWSLITVDGIEWNKNDVNVLEILSDNPDLFVRGIGTLPTNTEQLAFNSIDYAVFEAPVLTVYSKSPPATNIYAYIRGSADALVNDAAAIVLEPANWQSVTVDGITWYVNEITCSDVSEEHPVIFIRGSGTLPTPEEEEAYKKVMYAIGEPTKVKFYAKTAPITNVYVYARGVQL